MTQNTSELITISVAYAAQGQSIMRDFRLPPHSTVADALAMARASGDFPSNEDTSLGYAIFGQAADPSTMLHDGDRVEWLRPLLCDPKESRRRRAHR
ncbi:MAG: RnfH family protein [Burkholderiales bacterium]|jgi:putative ubiquitin-RnfH superfamily antitoxin RatB of RatAB toxin-antitoxin module|nr:RnfH family protein [Burkholderiales bacterium]